MIETSLLENNSIRSRLVSRFATLGREIWKHKEKYLLILPGMAWFIVFAYIPMYGLTLAFRQFRADLGLFGSPWIGLANFERVFADPLFMDAVWRTLYLNAGRLIFVFPVPIILALFVNELRLRRTKKILQSIFTFPNFLSWVIVAGIMIDVLGRHGLVNSLLGLLGFEPISFLGTPALFQPMVYLTSIWQSAGWSAIIYMAAIAGIDTEQYEAAEIDGSSRMQRIWYITLPGIKGTIVVLFILAIGNLMQGGFEQIFNLRNAATMRVAEILDVYIWRITFDAPANFGFSSAVALFRSVINFSLLFVAHHVSKRLSGSGLLA